ncbi:MAG: Dak phosphatase [Desulfotomaculum sp. 46_296]|nr:MAG: Dak phosphatase [Desulfotomaculum sp. 46_296]HAU31006.1 Dak phosphatase [Desulfotomaculum sp.]
MPVYSFDGNDLKIMLRGAVDLLGEAKGEVDSLNVFPVPDGDTGTNMFNSLKSAVREAESADTEKIGLVAAAAARGCLLGARGNSGVILSQFLSGFASILKDKETATAQDIARAFREGAFFARQAVMNPVEGTILTVFRKSAESAGTVTAQSDDLLRLLVYVLKKAFLALQETPEQLEVLKEAGVVDAGGKGFVVILEGMLQALKKASPFSKEPLSAAEEKGTLFKGDTQLLNTAYDKIKFAYCTEFLIKGKGIPVDRVKIELAGLGDSMLVVGNEEMARVHIHTNHPGTVLESCLLHGLVDDIKINNMLEQSKALLSIPAEETNGQSTKSDITGGENGNRNYAVVSVVSGDGLKQIMKSLGADVIVPGGQTLNPSTGEILNAIEEAPSQSVIVLPNNKNVILSAKQAGEASTKDVVVVPSRTVAQGIAALFQLDREDSTEQAVLKMNSALSSVSSGEIAFAVRETVYNGLKINKGDLIGIWNGELESAGKELEDVLADLLSKGVDEGGRLITIYYGNSVKKTEIEDITEKINREHPSWEFELHYGGQPVYELIISAE